MSKEPMVVACGPTEYFDRLPAAWRALIENTDGPYQRVACPRCARIMMLSRPGAQFIATGRANIMLCVPCIAEFIDAKEKPNA